MGVELLLRVALTALDEAGDPTQCRDVIESALAGGTAPELAARPPQRKQQVAWAAKQLAAHHAGHDVARAYRALRELLAALLEPVQGAIVYPAPAPEVALAMTAPALLDALAAPPRVVPAELARDRGVALSDEDPARRVLAIRALRKPSLPRLADKLAAIITSDPVAYVRAEAAALCAEANQATRGKLAGALGAYLEHERAEVRAAAIDGIRGLRAALDEARLAVALRDPSPLVRAAALHTILVGVHAPAASPANAGRAAAPEALRRSIDAAVLAALRDPEPAVCYAALGAVMRYTKLHGPALVEPLRAVALREDGDPRAAVYLLGKLGDPGALHACVACGRSDVAHVAELVLQQLGEPVHQLTPDERLARAARELASDDPEARRAGVLEARRLDARSLAPAIRALSQDVLARELLESWGETLPPALVLAPYRGQPATPRAVHGAYAIARAGDALGLWDAGTGQLLVAVDGAQLLELVPARAELAALRGWSFERYAVPVGTRLSALPIPAALAHGRPTSLVIAADLATVWCDHADAPYRFHIKLDPDRLLDETPHLGRRPRKRAP